MELYNRIHVDSICSSIPPVRPVSLDYKKASEIKKKIPSCGFKMWSLRGRGGNGVSSWLWTASRSEERRACWWCVSSGCRVCLVQYFGRRSLGDLDPANYFHSLAASKAKGYLGSHQRSTSRLSILSDPREPIESMKKKDIGCTQGLPKDQRWKLLNSFLKIFD